ncbi:MAG: M67 family metallopeptidase [Acidobacteriota bacterium]|nr:M67 family metallopeptidase [Blastocatellia bacterium]MDW8240898.1 M67 family metallopeptidase [Acidobacteriota bacterium]
MKIRRCIIAGIEQHARECAPRECCGLLAGHDDVIEHIYRLQNIATMPEVRYFADPKGIFQAQKLIRNRGQRLLGIYHSHPRSAPYPSPTDIAQAYYPEAVYFIISLDPRLQLRAFSIVNGQANEVAYQIIDD